MTARMFGTSAALLLALASVAGAADQASGTVTVQKAGTIRVSHAIAYVVRDSRDAHLRETEILLSDVAVDPASIRSALSPHMAAINADALKDRNYVLLWVRADGSVTMNATFSKTMTQIIDDTSDRLKVTWTARSSSRLDGHLFSSATLKTMDGTTYSVDLTFGADIPVEAAGTALPGGGEPGKALLALLAAARAGNWPAIKAASGPAALKMFDRSYNTPAENAADALDLLKAWMPIERPAITGGELRTDEAILDVEGEMFPGQKGLSLVRMVRSGNTWVFDQATRVGMVK